MVQNVCSDMMQLALWERRNYHVLTIKDFLAAECTSTAQFLSFFLWFL